MEPVALDKFLGSPRALFILVRSPGALNPFGTLSATCESFADLSRRNISLIPTAFESAMSASFAGKQITWPKHWNKNTPPHPHPGRGISRKFLVFLQGPMQEINVKSPYFLHYCAIKSLLSAGVWGWRLQLTSALPDLTRKQFCFCSRRAVVTKESLQGFNQTVPK